MTKHDTWVTLKPGSPCESILELFTDGMIPVRDPFPLERGEKETPLMIIDLLRLSSLQANAIAQLIAHEWQVDKLEVAADAVKRGGFYLNYEWVESMRCGPEGLQRSKELAIFIATTPQPLSAAASQEFRQSQYERWIDGNEEPPAINSIDDVDPRLRTPELEQAMLQRQIEEKMSGYSVFDILTGRAMVGILSAVAPENEYSLLDSNDQLTTEIPSDEFLMSKRDYVATALSLGVAVKILTENSDKTFEEWQAIVSEIGRQQAHSLTQSQVEKTITNYHQSKQDMRPSTLVEFKRN